MTAEEWGTSLTSLNWDYVLTMWKHRNEELNGKMKEEQDQIRKQNMIEELHNHQWEHRDKPMVQRRLIEMPAAKMQAMSIGNLASYISGVGILPKLNKQQRVANLRYYKNANFFKKYENKPLDPKTDRSELDPGEP
jgi:hypothetical protein